MVNAAKRMRALTERLFYVRNGAGSVSLQSASGPQLKSIYLRVPTGAVPSNATFSGSRLFRRTVLTRLKYWNPLLSAKIETLRWNEQNKDEPMYLTVTYESTSRDALANLKNSYTLGSSDFITAQIALKQQAHQQRTGTLQDEANAFSHLQSSTISHDSISTLSTPQQQPPKPVQFTPAITAHAPKDEILVKPQPPADPKQPQSTISPDTIYSRTLTLPIASLSHIQIWEWIRQHTGLPYRREASDDELSELSQLRQFQQHASEDRERVKVGVEAMKREQKQLKEARENAERMAAEAV